MNLRSSCDRYRAQKLRCVPSSTTDPTAPCQRCSRLKEPKSCVFSRRLRTGRHKKTADEQQDMPRKGKTKFTQSLPGMNTFTLSTSVSRASSVATDTSMFSGTSKSETQFNEDNALSVCSTLGESTMSDLWDHDGFLDPALAFAPSHPKRDIRKIRSSISGDTMNVGIPGIRFSIFKVFSF